jgi:DNA-binding transcriptional regulator YdaS (Cro superfamily)
VDQAISFSRFLDLVDRGDVRAVDIDWPDIQVSTTRGETFRTIGPNDSTLVQRLHAKGVIVTARSP